MKKTIFYLLITFCFVSIGSLSAQDIADGYRIQVLATGVQEKAVSLQSDLENFYPGEVYIMFEDPNYKVRIGNCEDRDTAEMLLLKVQELGYPTAWIVSTSIDVTKEDVTSAEVPVASTETVVDALPTKGSDCCPNKGYTLGLGFGYPTMTGAYLENSDKTPIYNVEIETPLALPLGPLSMGVSLDVFTYDYPSADNGNGFKGVAFMPKLSVGLNDLPFLPHLPVKLSAQFGGGIYDKHIGTAIGGAMEFRLSKVYPLCAKFYGRSNVVTGVVDGSPTGWIDGGLMLSYDVSKLF